MMWEDWLCGTGSLPRPVGVSPVVTCIQNPRPGRPCHERSGFGAGAERSSAMRDVFYCRGLKQLLKEVWPQVKNWD
jgi:hypothetical protein